MTITKFEELDIWKEARVLCSLVFKATSTHPFCKDYRFVAQIRASAGSIMDNIAEGFERDGRKEFVQYLSIAKGSCGECKSQLYRALDWQYISQELFEDMHQKAAGLSAHLGGFIKYLQNSEYKGTKYK